MAYKPIEIEFQFRNKRWQDAERGLAAVGGMLADGMVKASPELIKQLKAFLDSVAEALSRRHGKPWPGGTGARTLSRRSGRGIQSIRDSVDVVGNTLSNIEGRIGGNFYMRVQETGAVIRAKNKKYLTIPLTAALNPDGTPKKRSARDWDNTFVGKSKAGNLLIFQKQGGKVVPLYALKTQVKIPPRLGMQETLKAGLPYFVDKAFDAMLKKMLA